MLTRYRFAVRELSEPGRVPRPTLRRLETEDLEQFGRLHRQPQDLESGTGAAASNVPGAPEYRHAGDHPDLAYSRSVLHDIVADWATDGLGYFALGDRGNRLVGVGGVRRSGYVRANGSHCGDGSWNVYYRVGADSRGLGYAGAMVVAAAQQCARLEVGAVLTARVHPGNRASRRVVEKLGFQLVQTGLDAAGEPEMLFRAPASEVATATASVELVLELSAGGLPSTSDCPKIR